jgi:hypothetical protein
MTDLIALHHEYEDRMLKGQALFEDIESDIDARGDLDQDEKAALWLCAWAQIPVGDQANLRATAFARPETGPAHPSGAGARARR